MKKVYRIVIAMGCCLAIAGITVLILHIIIPKAQPELVSLAVPIEVATDQDFKVVAIGDSLTQGVGDEDGAGGYVPILGEELNQIYNFRSVEMFNYGKSGNITTQVTKRIEASTEIQEGISQANLVVVTIGANDLLNVVKGNILGNISTSTFDEPKAEYKTNIMAMWNEIRLYNPDCTIYIMGIYNPFYVHFREVTELQDIVDSWNETTQEFVEEEENTFFVPVNDLIYQGDGMISDEDVNDLLSTDDSFHPNHSGYQLIAKAFRDKIVETEDNWFIK